MSVPDAVTGGLIVFGAQEIYKEAKAFVTALCGHPGESVGEIVGNLSHRRLTNAEKIGGRFPARAPGAHVADHAGYRHTTRRYPAQNRSTNTRRRIARRECGNARTVGEHACECRRPYAEKSG